MPLAAAKILMAAGVEVGFLENKEMCCGNPALRIGDQDEFVAFAKENIKTFNRLGVKKVVCICPYCYSTFRRDYPEVGEAMNFEVVHILEMVDQLISEKRLQPATVKTPDRNLSRSLPLREDQQQRGKRHQCVHRHLRCAAKNP